MNDAQVKAVIGLRRHGKSSHIVRMTQSAPRVVYYDTIGDDYSEGVVIRDIPTFERFWRGVYRNRFRISLKPREKYKSYFPRFCNLAWECENLIVVVDEVHLYGGNFSCDEFIRIITGGGHPGVELIAATQAPKKLGELLRSQATSWDIFALREPDHAKYVAERCVGVDVSQILALRKYEYLHYEDGADCYWRCMDDLDAGETRKEAIPYETEAPAPAPGANPGDNAAAR